MPDVRRACAALHLGAGGSSPLSSIRVAGTCSPSALRLASRSQHRRPPEPAHIRSRPCAVLTTSPNGTRASLARPPAHPSRVPVHSAPPPFCSFGSSVFAAQNRRSVSFPGSTTASPCPASQCLRPRVPSFLINAPAKPPWPLPASFGGRGLLQPAPTPLGRA